MGEILEHFTEVDGLKLLSQCWRVLRPGGVIRVPNNAHFWRTYLQEYDAIREKPLSDWNKSHARWVLMFFREICVDKPKLFRSVGHFHKWMYDDVSLVCTLTEVGFRDAKRAKFGVSDRIHNIEAVEVRDDLIVEAVKQRVSF